LPLFKATSVARAAPAPVSWQETFQRLPLKRPI
jgi:hypothetical protein